MLFLDDIQMDSLNNRVSKKDCYKYTHLHALGIKGKLKNILLRSFINSCIYYYQLEELDVKHFEFSRYKLT